MLISFSIPRIFMVPVTTKLLSVLVKALDLNTILGWFLASNHFLLFACLFLMPFPVLMEFTSMLIWQFDEVRSCSLKFIVASTFLNIPSASVPENLMACPSKMVHCALLSAVNADKEMMEIVRIRELIFFIFLNFGA